MVAAVTGIAGLLGDFGQWKQFAKNFEKGWERLTINISREMPRAAEDALTYPGATSVKLQTELEKSGR